MDYQYENLGDERFQEFCNCLISKEFPNVQSYPVGQPDGGRDSIVYFMKPQKKDFIIFQIKYVRNPNSIKDPHKWLIETIKGEAPKVDKLIPRGAKKFILLTNVRGTAHLNAGSKDIINEILESEISIPAICWWRDDITMLFEKDPVFKWSFPEVLNGQDILNSALFSNLNENKEKRESIIKAYLIDQYTIDNEVKFRQIDLQNKLLDLYTDVPFRVKKVNEKNKNLKRTLDYLFNSSKRIIDSNEMYTIQESDMGAASFLLHPKTQNEIQKVLIEGGPGQGKSTISQYICQVHRIKLLNKNSDLNKLPDNIKNTPIRLPFKIDLRHIASWVENKNPYQGRLNDEFYSKIWKNSLESFLIAHIIYHSQIDNFTTSDLIAILRVSSVLFVFDGFDEIANIQVREDVIDFINKGINRLTENSNSIQVVITSRPAAFSNTIGFSEEAYPHFELTDITPSTIKNYLTKWIKASRLNSREAAEIKRLVNEKIELPHLKELAKSPMQLAIFISLLRTRGESLPNKRTALYDSYIELFFNRESEKNYTIRDHRDLIIDIHQYLAWVLHSEAEFLQNNGSIHIDELKEKLKKYLTKEGHKTDIADQLFHVMEERVCALVSRVQGTYEFEVQPLREYFCAKFLYNTSPYSPVGYEKPGTKPERFDAIARNFYWYNVVRFFAGCFDKGELPLLIQKLKELQFDDILKNTNYPRLLTSQILSDWVFTQYPLLLKDVVKIIIDGINIGNIIQDNIYLNNEPILLPTECGREEVVTECFEQLKKFPHKDYAIELLSIIRNNPLNIEDNWLSNLKSLNEEELIKWLEYAYRLEILYKLDDNLIEQIIASGTTKQKMKKLQLLINGNKLDVINNSLEHKYCVLDGILNNEINYRVRRQNNSSLRFLSLLFQPFFLSGIFFSDSDNTTYEEMISKRNVHFIFDSKKHNTNLTEFEINDEIDIKVQSFRNNISPILNSCTSTLKNSIDSWEIIVQNFQNSFGDNWLINIVAVIAAGIKSKNERFEEYSNLTDSSLSLCKRTRCARLKSGNGKYWKYHLNSKKCNLFTLLTMFTWATPKTLLFLLNEIELKVKNLTLDEYEKLVGGLKRTSMLSKLNKTQAKELIKKSAKCSDELKYILSHRLSEDLKIEFIYNHISSLNEKLHEISGYRLNYLIERYLHQPKNQLLLEEIKKTYSKTSDFNVEYYYYGRLFRQNAMKIPLDLAKLIMEESKEYPRVIASLAEKSCRLHANKNIKAVGYIAIENNWFD